jgi:hypothetical protein
MQAQTHLVNLILIVHQVKYKITFLPLNALAQAPVGKIQEIEPVLVTKKQEMQEFQKEYMDLKKR